MKKKIKIFLLFSGFLFHSSLFAQSTITGRVTDGASNLPLQGVTITEQGTNNVKLTDANGNFSISVSRPQAKLVISYVGYVSQTLDASSNMLQIWQVTVVLLRNLLLSMKCLIKEDTHCLEKVIVGSICDVTID